MRARINERLERATRFPVTLIAAPAGFGKSVALRDFLATHDSDAITYEVRREDGALLSFVRRLSEALEPVAPSAIASFPTMQERVMASDEPVRQISDWFVEHLKRAACTIVIDDLHYAATDPASIAMLADIIERTIPRIKWIIAARSDVGLPVATWIAYGQTDIPIGEEDLRFTTEEAFAAADTADIRIEPQEIETLRQLTEGWPVALNIAIRTRTHSADLRTASSGAREMVYRYLAEQIFESLSPNEKRFAAATSVFSTFTMGMASLLGYNSEFVKNLRARVAFLNEVSPGEYRYHDLFRDFLEAELRAAGEDVWKAALHDGAQVLEERGDIASALRLHIKSGDTESIVQALTGHGIALFERGESEIVSDALDVLPESVRGQSAVLLGLRAMIEAARGRYELADHAYKAAIERAEESGQLRARLVQRYGTELVRRGLDCIDLLEPYAKAAALDPALRATILGTLATSYLQQKRNDDALRTIGEALRIATPAADDTVLARILQQAAYVNRYGGFIPQARSYAELAVEGALKRNLYEVAARAYSVLYSIVYDEDDDPITALSILDSLGECARKGASSQARVFSIIASYDIEAERGNAAALDALEPLVRESKVLFPQAYAEASLPADALRASWRGDFATAYKLLADTANGQSDEERRALRYAEVALYAAAASWPQHAETALAQAAELFQEREPHSRRALRAQLFMAVTEMLVGHFAAAHQRIAVVERVTPLEVPRIRALAHAVRSLYRNWLGQGSDTELSASLERLDAENYGGFAKMLRAVPRRTVEEPGYSALTLAEREILQMLARGSSTKEIADRSGRSPHTVDTHVRAICRKLGCSGRREAVALAIGAGWVHA